MKKSIYIIVLLIVVAATIAISQTSGKQANQIGKKKFFYSWLVENSYSFGSVKYEFYTGGNTISSELNKLVKNCHEEGNAMDYMGNEGWELVSSEKNELGGGKVQYVYYFKKEVN
jgi:hypothetical protein